MTTTTIPADARFHSKMDWLESFHIFNFSQFYRDGRNGYGDLLVVNDDIVDPARGFGMHPHHDMEIVTWVLSGAISHEDNAGHSGIIRPGEVQQMSAGSGVLHSEMNSDPTVPVHLIQMWVLPDKKGVAPRYQQENVEHLIKNTLGCIASGSIDAPIHLHNATASLYVGRFEDEQLVELPTNEKLYIYVARGSIKLLDETGYEKKFPTGSSILFDGATTPTSITVGANSEIVVWSIDSHARLQSNFRD